MFNPVTATTVADLVAEGLLPPAPRVVDMGNQTFGVDGPTLERIARRLETAAPGLDLQALRALVGEGPGGEAAPHVGLFYQALGFSAYDAIDINSRHGSLVMDLNRDLRSDYGFTRTYDLVVNTGTSEHVFDQGAFLRNAHALAGPGAVMLHAVPFLGYLNHGFYNYQPNLFLDLAAANGYEVRRLWLADRNRPVLDLMRNDGVAREFPSWLHLVTPNERGNGLLLAVLRKTADGPFAPPCQGRYLETVEERTLQARYAIRSAAAGSAAAASTAGPPPRLGPRGRGKRALLRWLRRASRFVLLRL